MPTRQIATSTLWQIASQVVMAAMSILTVKFVAIGLTKELAGFYNSSYGYLQLFGILADFGLYAVAVREVSRAKQREHVLGALLVLRTLILLLSLGIALLLVWLLPTWQGTALPLSVTIAAFVPFFTLLAGMLRTVFQVEYKMQYVFVAEVVQRIVTVSLIGGTVLYFGLQQSDNLSYLYRFLAYGGVGAVILFLISLIFGNRLIPVRIHFDRTVMKATMKAAAPYGVAFLCMALYRQFDITLIALLRDDFELQNAYYGFVVRMTDMGFLIPTFLLNSTLPVLSEMDARKSDTRELIGKTFMVIMILGSVSLLFSALWARPLIQLLTTEAYLSTPTSAGSDTALMLMSIPLFLNGIVLYSFYVLLTKNQWRSLVASLLIGAGLALALNIWLIPVYGFVGAALTSIAVHLVLAALLLPQGLRAMPMTLTTRHIREWLLFSGALALGLWLLKPLLTNELSTIVCLSIASVYMLTLVWTSGLLRSLGIDKS